MITHFVPKNDIWTPHWQSVERGGKQLKRLNQKVPRIPKFLGKVHSKEGIKKQKHQMAKRMRSRPYQRHRKEIEQSKSISLLPR